MALGTALPRILSGSAPALALGNVNDFGVAPRNPQAQPLANTFESMYAGSVDAVLHGTAQETFDAVKMLKAADPAKYRPAAGVSYPKGRFADALKQTAQLVKANLGVQVAFTDIGGWDHHVNEGASEGQLGNLLKEFSGSLAAFWQDLGALAEDTVVVTMSEFGRTARENGTRGTDHGHANVMFVMGGAVRGGKVYGRWPGLDERATLRAARPGTDHRLSPGDRRGGSQAARQSEAGPGLSRLPQPRIFASAGLNAGQKRHKTVKLARSGARIHEVPIRYCGRSYAEGKRSGFWTDWQQRITCSATGFSRVQSGAHPSFAKRGRKWASSPEPYP